MHRSARSCSGGRSFTTGAILPIGCARISMVDEVVAALSPVVDALTAAGVSYRVGGSVASSALGVPRSTLDVDIVCALRDEHVAAFVERLAEDYYVDADMVREAIRTRASFNLVHLKTMVKVDIFVQRGDAFSRASFARVTHKPLDETPGARTFDLMTAEDIILRKLEWYELGGRTSERQWNDVLGVLRVQREELDWKYLDEWAGAMGLDVLLAKAKTQSGA